MRSTYTVDARWADAVAAFVVAQRAADRSADTIARRVKQVERFARETGISPWHATREDVRGWVDNLAMARSTRMAHRDSLRAFYRWALVSRRTSEDPTEEPSQRLRRLEASPAWETELTAYRAAMRAAGRPESTVQVRMSQLRRFARENASLEPLSVTLDDLLEWLGTKRWAAETRRAQRSAFRSFYSWAKATGRITKNPAKKMPVIAKGQPHARPALDSDYTLALTKASKRERLALRLAAEMGLRCAEVASVHGRDVSGSAGTWSLTVHGKGNKIRVLPLRDDLAGALRTAGDGFVFPGQWEGHLSPHYLGKLISALLPAGVTMHMLRHRFATKAYDVDRDVFSVQQLLGHASPATTQGYVQLSDSSLRRLVDAVAAGRP
jgi:site-specific recombinase XerD